MLAYIRFRFTVIYNEKELSSERKSHYTHKKCAACEWISKRNIERRWAAEMPSSCRYRHGTDWNVVFIITVLHYHRDTALMCIMASNTQLDMRIINLHNLWINNIKLIAKPRSANIYAVHLNSRQPSASVDFVWIYFWSQVSSCRLLFSHIEPAKIKNNIYTTIGLKIGKSIQNQVKRFAFYVLHIRQTSSIRYQIFMHINTSHSCCRTCLLDASW